LYLLVTTKELKLSEKLVDFLPVKVPKQKPITRAQYEDAKVLWPTKFHEDKRFLIMCVLV
jgi:hypothetical protein